MTPTSKPAVVPLAAGTVLEAFGDQLTVKLGGAQTNGAFALCSYVTPPGGGPPPHFHLHEDEVFILQEGQARFCLEGQWSELHPGDVIFVPRGIVHTFQNTGRAACRQWILTTPAGFETFFARCAAEFARPGGPDLERIREISAQHGIHYLEPVPEV